VAKQVNYLRIEDIEKTYRKNKLNKGEGYIRKGRRRGGVERR